MWGVPSRPLDKSFVKWLWCLELGPIDTEGASIENEGIQIVALISCNVQSLMSPLEQDLDLPDNLIHAQVL